MARHPDWFERLETIINVVRQTDQIEWLGRDEIKAIFSCSERDSIRLLHKFGAEERQNRLSLPRSALLSQLEAIKTGSTYAAFLQRRHQVAKHLHAASTETASRRFLVGPPSSDDTRRSFERLPNTISWRRTDPNSPGRFEIRYSNGADLMWQLAEFLGTAGVNREEFVTSTEPLDETSS